MKIFDCVTFFEENRLMELRFNILNNYVDKLIICDAKYNHQRLKKKINFTKNNFTKFTKKITNIIEKKFQKNLNNYKRQ